MPQLGALLSHSTQCLYHDITSETENDTLNYSQKQSWCPDICDDLCICISINAEMFELNESKFFPGNLELKEKGKYIKSIRTLSCRKRGVTYNG